MRTTVAARHCASEKPWKFGDLLAHQLVDDLTADTAARSCVKAILDDYKTLGALRDQFGEKDKWAQLCKDKKFDATFAEAAARHVVVEYAVDDFLKAKGVKHHPGFLTHNILRALDEEASEKGEKDLRRAERARRLLHGDIKHREGDKDDKTPHLMDAFEVFQKRVPVWSDPKASFFLYRDVETILAKRCTNASAVDDMEAFKKALPIARRQHSGLCYRHAPAVVQEVEVALNTGKSPSMLDVAKFFVDHGCADEIYEHIVKNRGGGSLTFLRQIMGLKEGDVVTAAMGTVENYVAAVAGGVAGLLQEHGVALVSSFQVERAFRDSTLHGDRVSFAGQPNKDEFEGRHAMVMVGHREADGQHYFLLQNWWEKLQLVEVDAEYLAACGASVSFVKKKVSEIPASYPQARGVFAMETEDIGEQLEPEMRGG